MEKQIAIMVENQNELEKLNTVFETNEEAAPAIYVVMHNELHCKDVSSRGFLESAGYLILKLA